MWLPRAQTHCTPQESYCIWAGRRGSEGACGHVVWGSETGAEAFNLGFLNQQVDEKSRVRCINLQRPLLKMEWTAKGRRQSIENLAYFSNSGSIGWSFTASLLLYMACRVRASHWAASLGDGWGVQQTWTNLQMRRAVKPILKTQPVSVCLWHLLLSLQLDSEGCVRKNPLYIPAMSNSEGEGQWTGRKRVKK